MSVFGIINEIVSDDFTVTNKDGLLVTDIEISDFSFKLYDSDGLSITILPVTFQNLGNGNYRVSFTPNKLGLWYIVVYHPIYFPWGKAGDIQVFTEQEYYSSCSSGLNIQRRVGKITQDRLIYPI